MVILGHGEITPHLSCHLICTTIYQMVNCQSTDKDRGTASQFIQVIYMPTKSRPTTHVILNTELYDLRKIICLRKSEVSFRKISVCSVIENLAEHGIHCLPCFYSKDIITM